MDQLSETQSVATGCILCGVEAKSNMDGFGDGAGWCIEGLILSPLESSFWLPGACSGFLETVIVASHFSTKLCHRIFLAFTQLHFHRCMGINDKGLAWT